MLVVGAPEALGAGGAATGAIVAFGIGDGSVTPISVPITLPTGLAGDLFGAALATGDYDGNGQADLAVGAPGVSPGGAVYLYMNISFPITDEPPLERLGDVGAGARFGGSIAQGAMVRNAPLTP